MDYILNIYLPFRFRLKKQYINKNYKSFGTFADIGKL